LKAQLVQLVVQAFVVLQGLPVHKVNLEKMVIEATQVFLEIMANPVLLEELVHQDLQGVMVFLEIKDSKAEPE
jgi:hypothetical protein